MESDKRDEVTCEICDGPFGGDSRVCLNCWNPTVKENCELLEQIKDFRREMHKLELRLREAQEIIKLCVDQGGLSFHDEWRKCPEDDTCVCPDVKRVNAALRGYRV